MGLPFDAACWGQDELLIRRQDEWFSVLVGLQAGQKVHRPAPLILKDRGRTKEPPKKKKKASLREAMAWFAGLARR